MDNMSLFTGLLSNALAAVQVNTNVQESPAAVPPEERVITIKEVSCHDEASDCWIIIYDRVYDVTDFLDEHPGGADLLLEFAGREASSAFRGSGHSSQALRALDRFCVGELPMHERIFRKPGGYKLSDIPE
ncbi:cytochrome b5 [Leptinotarsa decemlineata]|uniref:cytochrome b5 n=1 Tax=Leptinotarsa decemlineata TaxID=7539 RepID=UPI000C254845|nr:uncharacterized protein LOC111505521 [Leptinotarsa decemlineata]